VILALTVRKFVCPTPSCPRRIFTERLPGLVQSYARMTTRLIALVQALGVGAGGQLGTRQAERSGIATTPSTLLRHLMQLPAPMIRAVRVLGVDDFAWKKRQVNASHGIATSTSFPFCLQHPPTSVFLLKHQSG